MTAADARSGSSGRLSLGSGREFDAIRRWVGQLRTLPEGVTVGPGDDAAVLEGGWVVSTDLMVEDVHFRRGWITRGEVGFRAAAAALSDLAAMAARPVAVLVSVAAPPGDEEGLDAVQQGVREAAALVGAAVVGGDLSSSPGPLFLDVVALGRAERPVLRSGARPGDELWVTGTLGAAAGAVRAWQEGREPSPGMRAAFTHPTPRVAEAEWLADHADLRALVDLSDGLAGDAGHLAAGGGVRVVLEAARLPLAFALQDAVGAEAALLLALHGGEDYELCLAAAPGSLDREAFQEALGLPVTRVGRVEEGEGVWVLETGGDLRRVEKGGFDHLAGGGT